VPREAVHVAGCLGVVRIALTPEADARSPYVSVEVSLQIEGHFAHHASEPHPSRDLARDGVGQLAL